MVRTELLINHIRYTFTSEGLRQHIPRVQLDFHNDTDEPRGYARLDIGKVVGRWTARRRLLPSGDLVLRQQPEYDQHRTVARGEHEEQKLANVEVMTSRVMTSRMVFQLKFILNSTRCFLQLKGRFKLYSQFRQRIISSDLEHLNRFREISHSNKIHNRLQISVVVTSIRDSVPVKLII